MKQHGVELWSFDGQQDIYSAAGRLGVRAQAMVGAFEVERTGERVREMKRQKAKQGFYMGPTPFGFTSQARVRRDLEARYGEAETERAKTEAQQAIPVSGHLFVDEVEAQVVREVFRLYVDEGLGCGRIARRLNARGHRTRQGCLWCSQQVQKIVKDPKVAGHVTFDEDAYDRRVPSKAQVHEQTLYPAKHEAIVPIEQWREAQRVRSQNGASNRGRDFTPRSFALSGVLVCRDGHTAKAKSCGMVSGHLYYGCRRRFIDGADPALGGCDAPIIRVEAADAAVRRVLADLLSHPEQVHAYLDAASRQTRRDRVPQADRSHDLDEQIQKMEQAVERYFKLLEGTEPGSDEERVLLDRVVELRRRLAEARAERENLRCEVIPLPPRVTREQVEAWCRDLTRHLESDARGFRRLVEELHDRHDLRVQILDADRVRVSLAIDPADLTGGHRLVAVARVELEGSEEAALSTDEWVQREQAKDPRCACGCGGSITVRPQHRAASKGIPTYLPGHAKSPMEKVIDEIHAAGFRTAQDVMRVLGCGESQISRLVKAGRLVPAGKWTVGGRRVRYFEKGAG
ncbi:MAG: recombinase family protein [Deltaproteobacteria bacterium]|nr:recombinase family protein [Deltaproteobacteria bacterium]